MQVTITQTHINQGTQYHLNSCPVALAIIAAGLDGQGLYVHKQYVYLRGRGSFGLPEEVRKFIADFDTGKPVEPFSFDLPIPSSAG